MLVTRVSALFQGERGEVGSPGSPGKDGNPGRNGQDGAPGERGNQGPQVCTTNWKLDCRRNSTVWGFSLLCFVNWSTYSLGLTFEFVLVCW